MLTYVPASSIKLSHCNLPLFHVQEEQTYEKNDNKKGSLHFMEYKIYNYVRKT